MNFNSSVVFVKIGLYELYFLKYFIFLILLISFFNLSLYINKIIKELKYFKNYCSYSIMAEKNILSKF
jgi:hypothetical protein